MGSKQFKDNHLDQQLCFTIDRGSHAKYETTKEVWDHLNRLYVLSNFAKQYQLEVDMWALQQNMSLFKNFILPCSTFWDQLALTKYVELQSFKPYID